MLRSLIVSIAALALAAGLSFADPGVRVVEVGTGIRIVLDGDYARSTYSVWRARQAESDFMRLTDRDVLCTGECFASDFDVAPGQTWFYRFDVLRPDGSFQSFGPFPVRIPDHPVAVRMAPNPGAGTTRLELSLPGNANDPPVAAEARLLDVQGRTLRVLFAGGLPRGVTNLSWDGKDERGRSVGSGVFFVRFASRLGVSVTRVHRVR